MANRSMQVVVSSMGTLVGMAMMENLIFKSLKVSPEVYTKELIDATARAYGLSLEEVDTLIDMVMVSAKKYVTEVCEASEKMVKDAKNTPSGFN